MESGTPITIAGLVTASSVTIIDKLTEEYTKAHGPKSGRNTDAIMRLPKDGKMG